MSSFIPLSHPDIDEADIEAVAAAMRSGRLSIGPRQSRFEEILAERTQRRHAVAVASGTAGLHLALLALNIGAGDEVITTPFSFIASANCILMVGAKPVFVDIDPRSLNMDPAKVEAAITHKTKAIIGVEVFGNPSHMDKLAQIAGAHEIPLIEDSCEGLGGRYKGRPIGSFGRVAVFGFYPNKQITTGEGGMIVTDDDKLADTCRILRNQGRTDDRALGTPTSASPRDRAYGSWLAHQMLGYNYRLSEIACALGISQMERLDSMLVKRRTIAGNYMRRLIGFPDLILPNVPPESGDATSWWVFAVRLDNEYSSIERDRIIDGLRRHDVGAANYFPCIHLQPFYRERFGFGPGMCPIAESISQRTIALPFFNAMDDTQVEIVCLTLKVMLDRERLLKS